MWPCFVLVLTFGRFASEFRCITLLDEPLDTAERSADAETVRRHFHQAVAAGADVVRDLHVSRTPAFPQGSSQFDLRDPEGNLWTVGTYHPKSAK